MIRFPYLLVSCCLLLLGGCGTFTWGSKPAPYQADARLVTTSHEAVDQLLAAIPPHKALDRKQPVIVASLVNIDDLRSSRLGRTVAEQLGTRLSTQGYAVVELKLRDTIFIRQGEGELLLSREVREISRNHQAQAVLVGTYAQALSNVYLTLKLVGVADNQVIAAHDFVLPVDAEVRALLWSNGR
jgi:TolB-like protein